MENVLFACATHRDLDFRTYESVKKCAAPIVTARGISGLGLARNITLDATLKAAEGTSIETVLMLDDDMVFTPEDAAFLVEASRKYGMPVSAMYALSDGNLAASPIPKSSPGPSDLPWTCQRWMTGLGLVAIPIARLRDLKTRSETLIAREPMTAFTWEGSGHDGYWYGEDMRLCRRLGGVLLAPVPVGHVKARVLYPDTEAVELVKTRGTYER